MKWQSKLLWGIIVLLVGMGVWILSFPFSDDHTDKIVLKDGFADLSDYNFVVNGPASFDGRIGYIRNQIIYDDEYFEDHASDIEYVSISEFLNENEFGNKGHGTFVMEIIPPTRLSVIALEVPDVSTAYKMWVNGEHVLSSGRVSPLESLSEPMTMIKRIIIPTSGERLRILIQMSNYDHYHMGFHGSVVIGTADQIMERQINSTLREYLILATGLLIGLYHIAIFAMREDEVAALHFGLFAIFLALTMSLFGEKSIYNIYPLLGWNARMQLGFLFSLITSLLLFRYVLLLGDRHRDTAVEFGIQLILILSYAGLSMTMGKSVHFLWTNIYIAMVFVVCFYSFVHMVEHMRRNRTGMKLAVFGMFSAVAVFLYDMADIYDEKFASYGLFIFIFTQALALGFRYSESFKVNLNLASELRYNAKILEERNTEIILAKNKLEELNKELDNKVNERTEDIRLLLDHSGQAFLSLNEYSVIQPGYSKLTKVFLGDNIRGRNLWDILYEDSTDTADLMKAAISRAVHEKSELRRSSYMAILPETLNYKDHDLSIEYKWIKTDFKEQIMIIMTDITYKTALVKQMNVEVQENWTTVKIVLNSNEFWTLYDEFVAFLKDEVHEQLQSPPDLKATKAALLKRLHYFKGSFSIYGLEEVVEGIHKIENKLGEADESNIRYIKSIFINAGVLGELKKRLNKIIVTEGVDIYQYREAAFISKKRLDEITNEIEARYGDDASDLLNEIRMLSHQPFKRLFDYYVDYISVLGKNIGKEVNPLQITGGEFMVDPTTYEGFSRSLVHLFRNMVDHGIEKPELRYERGKPVTGNIDMKIMLKNYDDDPLIRIEISDDGNGIDVDSLINSVSRSIGIDQATLQMMDRKRLYQYIFAPEITTRESGDIVSGRGLGMTIFLEEINALGGRIEVDSAEQLGIRFVIELPYLF